MLPRPGQAGLHTGLLQGVQAEPTDHADSPGPGTLRQEYTSSDVSGSQGGALSHSQVHRYPPPALSWGLWDRPWDGASVPGTSPAVPSPQSRVLKQHVGERNFHAFIR